VLDAEPVCSPALLKKAQQIIRPGRVFKYMTTVTIVIHRLPVSSVLMPHVLRPVQYMPWSAMNRQGLFSLTLIAASAAVFVKQPVLLEIFILTGLSHFRKNVIFAEVHRPVPETVPTGLFYTGSVFFEE
jgi:hypothetical protein